MKRIGTIGRGEGVKPFLLPTAAIALAAGLAISGCGSNSSGNASAEGSQPAATTAPAASPTSGAETAGAGPYCDTAPKDRQKPLGVRGGHLVLAVRSECVGDPTAPAGVYSGTQQIESESLGVEANGTRFTADCYYPDGEYIQTNAAAAPDGKWATGSNMWVKGEFPGVGPANIPLANIGFAVLSGSGITVKPC